MLCSGGWGCLVLVQGEGGLVPGGCLVPGVAWSPGVPGPRGGASLVWGECGIPACTEADPPLRTESQTPVKISPLSNFVAGGKNTRGNTKSIESKSTEVKKISKI